MRGALLVLLAISLGNRPVARAERPPSGGGISLARASLPLALPTANRAAVVPPHSRATRAQRMALQSLLEGERQQLAMLQRLAHEVLEAEEDLARARRDERTLSYRRAEAERRLKALRGRQEEAETRARARLLRLYKLTRGRYARALATAPSAAERTRRARLLRYVVRRDLDELSTFVRERRALEREERAITKQQEAERDRRVALRRRRENLARAERTQRQALGRLFRKRRRKQRLAGALSRASRRLIAGLARSRRAMRGSGFVARRGCLRAPVKGHRLRARARGAAGQTRPGIVWRTHGRPQVRVVHGGVVRAARVVEGFGRVVLVEHGEGYFTLYGFLSRVRVKVGQRVKQQAPLGRAGIDPLSGARALYFEVRREAQALDAAAWLGHCPRS